MRYVIIVFLLAACRPTLDLGVTNPTGTGTTNEGVTDVDAVSGPTSSTGATGTTGTTATTGVSGNTGGATGLADLAGVWVRDVPPPPNARPLHADRLSFAKSGAVVSTIDPWRMVTLAYELRIEHSPTRLQWLVGGQVQREDQRNIFAYFWRHERYPYLAYGSFKRQGAGTGPVGFWKNTFIITENAETTTYEEGYSLLADGSATHSLNVFGTQPTPLPISQHGTYTCPEPDLCAVVLGGFTIELHFVTADELVDAFNSRWDRARTCATGGPALWTVPSACPPFVAQCQAGQTADWDGCVWSCEWPQRCDNPTVTICKSQNDCAAGETCEFNSIGMHDPDPTISALRGLCVKPRKLCGNDSECGADSLCSYAHCPLNATCQGQCEHAF
ncbi:MAG: hypothetical protein IT381_32135 [Deltaproteobacteria bacterium]|nr:hypothetical protein [Deltaproteobacteria bacterium]